MGVSTLNVDFSNDFTITAVDLVYDEEASTATTKTVDYTVTSCQCDADSACNDPAARVAIKQSDKIYLCFGVTATDVIISKVASLELVQGEGDTEIRLPAVIAPDSFNALTTVENEGTQNVLVRTQFVAVFFQDISKAGSAVGTLTLDFKSSASPDRRMRQVTVDIPARVLQEGSSTVDVSISGVVFDDEGLLDESSATSNGNFMLAVSVMVFFCVFV